MSKFANDTKLGVNAADPSAVAGQCADLLLRISDWSTIWLMPFNTDFDVMCCMWVKRTPKKITSSYGPQSFQPLRRRIWGSLSPRILSSCSSISPQKRGLRRSLDMSRGSSSIGLRPLSNSGAPLCRPTLNGWKEYNTKESYKPWVSSPLCSGDFWG